MLLMCKKGTYLDWNQLNFQSNNAVYCRHKFVCRSLSQLTDLLCKWYLYRIIVKSTISSHQLSQPKELFQKTRTTEHLG
ncbi:hypothetical protein EUGRSUZ_H01149 [Eucalyptus grandis]|uniref:Uncharacterized protein n=2 Tax=Eucalyptus grandis TaxID=71139 RepID=A0ACC3JPQ0_EUCGR|nr:hypothetical protein EUGRSUZ_H01149 [Eucalyptus grandis]